MNFSKVRGGRESNKKHQTIISKNKETTPQLFDILFQKRRKKLSDEYLKFYLHIELADSTYLKALTNYVKIIDYSL